MDTVQASSATGWSVELTKALKYVVDLFKEGDVTDVRYWIMVILALSIIWGPVALYYIRKRSNGP